MTPCHLAMLGDYGCDAHRSALRPAQHVLDELDSHLHCLGDELHDRFLWE